MSVRDLQLTPNSLTYFLKASSKIFNSTPKISTKQKQKFDIFDKTLMDLGIYPRDYAYRLLEHLQGWVKKRGWKCMPVNIFLGKWALNLYQQDIGNKQWTSITDCEEHVQMVVMEEFQILQYMLHYDVSRDVAVDELLPVLSRYWRNIDVKTCKLVQRKAIELFEECCYVE